MPFACIHNPSFCPYVSKELRKPTEPYFWVALFRSGWIASSKAHRDMSIFLGSFRIRYAVPIALFSSCHHLGSGYSPESIYNKTFCLGSGECFKKQVKMLKAHQDYTKGDTNRNQQIVKYIKILDVVKALFDV